MRERAVLIAEPRLNDSPALPSAVLACADDQNLRVRFQVAFTLGEMKSPQVAKGPLHSSA